MTGIKRAYVNWMVLAIIFPFHNLRILKKIGLIISTKGKLWTYIYSYVGCLTVTSDIQKIKWGNIKKNLIHLSDIQDNGVIYNKIWYTENTQQELLHQYKRE